MGVAVGIRNWLGLCVAAGVLLGLGCSGKSEKPTTDAAKDAPQSGAESTPASTAAPLPANAAPSDVVRKFLESLEAGQQKTTAALLTSRALAETSKNNFSLTSMAATGLECSIGRTEHPDPQTAHVASSWTEGEGADAQTYEVLWVLKSTSEGWRIAGMATAIFPGEPPVWFDFENGEEFRRKMEETDAEVARREQAAAQQAQLPAGASGVGPER